MKRNHVWIVEWLNRRTGKWEPDNKEHWLTRKGFKFIGGADTALRDYRKRQPHTKFRLTKYEAAKEG